MTASLTPPSSIPLSPAAVAPDAGTYTDLNGLSALKNAPTSPATIKAVSQQVEALFLQMMLKSMRDATDAEGGGTTSNETGMYQDMFDKQVALTLSKRQDLGIARLFERQLGGKTAPAPAGNGSAIPLRPGQTRAEAEGGRPSAQSTAAAGEHAAAFVQSVMPTIQRAAQALGVNPLGMLAQAALETGWGKRMPRTADGAPSLNLFGVKAGDGWNGARAVADTVEVPTGRSRTASTISRACSPTRPAIARRLRPAAAPKVMWTASRRPATRPIRITAIS
jgi:flagellar protein FlgJ